MPNSMSNPANHRPDRQPASQQLVPQVAASSQPPTPKPADHKPTARDGASLTTVVTAISAMVGIVWAYWPTLLELAGTWDREPDYSHGYLVFPAALFLLWNRWADRPKNFDGSRWGGAVLLLISAVMRYIAAKYFISAVDGWSIPVTISGLVWLLCGGAWIRWSWPAIAFLFFMVPLPWRAESLLSSPLQHVATMMSSWGLQAFGFPAVQQGNTILLGEFHLEVEQACSGLRMLLSVTALTCGYLILKPLPWWQRSLLLVAIAPIALISNAIRIITTGILYQSVSSESARTFSHDLAGWVVIPIATALLFCVVAYTHALVVEYEQAPLVRRPH